MSERDGYEPGVPCWVAAVHADPETAAGFYTGLFGWEAENLMPPDHPGKYFLFRRGGRRVAAVVSQHGAPPPPEPMWGTYVWVESADDAAARVADAGGSVIAEPFDSPGGGRMAVLADPQGAVFGVWQPGANRGAEVVNEPGAWSMSSLTTSDPEGAKAFYGEVFGWTTESFDMGEGEFTMYCVPGYEGGEPQQPVSREVVAVMLPPSAADPGPPRWNLDFWVDDVDATAERAVELGGTVAVPPYDTPGFKQAVLADPGGARFAVSRVNK